MIVIKSLQFGYSGQDILTGFSMKVHEGEFIGIVGPNGTGKTTLLRLISGVLKPRKGSVTVNGITLDTLKPSERAKLVSVVPQNPQLPMHFAVIDLVLMGRNPHLKLLQWEGRKDLKIVQNAMDMTGTSHLRDREIGTLSGGERQRVMIAMVLAQGAPIILLDEPTSSLDLAHQTGVLDLLRDIQKQRGGAVIMAMHDLTLASQYCHRIVMMASGREYAEGSPPEVLTVENISKVYGIDVELLYHPQNGMPVVLPSYDMCNLR